MTEIWVGPDGSIFQNVHSGELCEGTYCCLHNPSDHHMKEWTLRFRNDKKIMTRICSHGIDHPDPDDLAFGNRLYPGSSFFRRMHGCCGCCKEPK